MFTWSENPSQDMWNHLSFLGKVANSKKLLNGEIESNRSIVYQDGAELDKKALQVAMCINQAREYFSAAEKVTIITSPLFYFYGMLSLAKSLIVANIPGLNLENINYHGLHTRPIEDYLKEYQENSDNWSIEEEFAVANEGVFKYLTEIFNGFSFEKNSVFRFKDLLSICPELSKMYEKYYKELSKTIYLYSAKSRTDPTYQLELSFTEVNKNRVYECFPEFKDDFQLATELVHNQARKFVSINLTEFPSYIGLYYPLVGGKYVVGGINYYQGNDVIKKYIHQAIADYIGLFILSICVRYKQDLWGSVVQGQQSGVLGLIELYISIVKRRYPNFILDQLFGENFRYGTPGYLT